MGCTLDDFVERVPTTMTPVSAGFRVRAIAFDLDSTLVDIVRVKERAAEAAAWALADAGLDIDPAIAAREIMSVAYEIGIDDDSIVDEYLRRRIGMPDPRLITVGRHAYERAEDQNVVAYPRVHKTLLELTRRGFPLVLITDAPRHRAVRRLQAARLLPFFRELIAGEDTPRGKADSRPYQLATQRLGVAAHELLMVGDNPRRDIGVARQFGCRTVLARYGLQAAFHSDDPLHVADANIEWLDELLALASLPDEPSSRLPFDVASYGLASNGRTGRENP